TSQFSFGRILNLTTAPIRATATAAKGSPKYVSCPFPMAVYDSDGNPTNGLQTPGGTYTLGSYYPMYMSDWMSSTSNSGALDVGSGANDIRNAISSNCSGPIVQDTGCPVGVAAPCATTKSGVMSGPIEQGLTYPTPRFPNGRMESCHTSTSQYCPGGSLEH